MVARTSVQGAPFGFDLHNPRDGQIPERRINPAGAGGGKETAPIFSMMPSPGRSSPRTAGGGVGGDPRL
jgi:hypothetical protein